MPLRFNKSELLSLGTQPSHKYEKEGVLILKEKSEGFFRRSDTYNERWFRLSGNLLFYLQNADQWSDPVGVVVLEDYSVVVLEPVQPSNKPPPSGFPFTIAFKTGGVIYHFTAPSEDERKSWVAFLRFASFATLKGHLDRLRLELELKRSSSPVIVHTTIKKCGYVEDVSESPICEIALSADNLRCDSFGRAPASRVVAHVRNSPIEPWVKYGATEITKRTSNPSFLTTLSFRASDNVNEQTELQLTVYHVRDAVSETSSVIGHLTIPELGSLKLMEKTRLPIVSPQTRQSLEKNAKAYKVYPSPSVGFLTIYSWNLEREERSSTESTPCRINPYEPSGNGSRNNRCNNRAVVTFAHRRTQSLPPKLGSKLKIPLQNNFHMLFSNPFVATYRFHSGLGGDIFVHEIMAESKLSFAFPKQLLSLWIAEEKELMHEIIGMGQLREPWHSRQIQMLERHMCLISIYNQAIKNIDSRSQGPDFKQSSTKADPSLEFVPLNLHLQRMWAQNASLHKNGFHDTYTVGGFTAFAQGYDSGGLSNLIETHTNFVEKEYRARQTPFITWYVANKVISTCDSVQRIKRLRKEIVERMHLIMKLAKERTPQGMAKLVEEIYHRCQLLLKICDQSLIEEAFEFFERQKLSQSLTGFCYENEPDQLPASIIKSSSTSSKMSNSIAVDEGVVDSPNSPMRSVVDMFKRREAEMGGREKENEDRTPDSGLGIDEIVKSFLDSPASNYYGPTEEPEPYDLTKINIEASMISLNTRVKSLCGQGAEIETKSLRPTSLITRVHSIHGGSFLSRAQGEGASWRKSLREDTNSRQSLPPPSAPPPPQKNNVCVGIDLNGDWSEELRPSVKKLRLAMDALLKTSRLAHSIYRIQENDQKSQLGYIIKYRRDVCFSHALTSLVVGLMGRIWSRKPDPSFLFVLTRIGPLISFNSFLTYFSDGAGQFNDMIVAIEDLKTVEFVLVMAGSENEGSSLGQNVPIPKVHGSRSGMKVLLPVPQSVFAMLPLDSTRSTSFVITPVFFNIGINEKAVIAERIGNMEPQEKSNMENFAKLNEYYRRFKKLTLPVKFTSKRNQTVEPNIEILLDKMHSELLSRKKRNVEVLHLSGQIARALMGIRFSNCKSGKDRTGMGVTLEQAHILSRDYDLAEHEFQLVLDAMRSEGTRRENLLKNIGHRKYAFTNFQAFALPKLYQPPQGTYSNVQT